ncbi:hypothetical protein [Massilia litorea]|uniref:Uncharacterized protein n=1 Tax=Massilia litorea TaxID=2769491 RepID=A0A7L9U2I3_9BURK|nr:hypothetical protein [Massilia litorea]QOL48492.1 hypothetical protein LPB04_16150 [Massilia litorea]
MAFHQRIQALLLLGVRFPAAAELPAVAPPAAIADLVSAIAPAQEASNNRAIRSGNRYRSAFWGLYLLSAMAVLCAVMPLALGWDNGRHAMHAWAPYWAVLEVVLIAVLGLLYRRGHRQDWQGQWLASRTEAELARYLPLVAPLAVPAHAGTSPSWYARLGAGALHVSDSPAINALCARHEPAVAATLRGAWSSPAFVGQYVDWAVAQFDAQRGYHDHLALRSEALMHRVHKINACLFVLTLGGALAHLAVHSMWLSFVTIFFPSLGASLHGALAQTESYRLAATARRLSAELGQRRAAIMAAHAEGDEARVRAGIEGGLGLILGEHRDWHMLVRPHHLPLG